MDEIRTFLDMGGYARFIWPAYIFTALVMIGLLLHVLRDLARNEAELGRLRRRPREARAQAAGEAEAHVGEDA